MKWPVLSNHKEFIAAMRSLRDQGFFVTGPFKRKNGTLVVAIGKTVLTEAELIALWKSETITFAKQDSNRSPATYLSAAKIDKQRELLLDMRILVVDDHETVRKGVCTILSSRKNLEVCGEAADGREAVEKALQLNPDLILLDVSMPVLGGLDAARQIRNVLEKVPILILSMHDSRSVIREAQLAGTQGFVNKSETAKTLLKAVDAVTQGQTFFPNN